MTKRETETAKRGGRKNSKSEEQGVTLFEKYIEEYKKTREEPREEFDGYNKASFINGFLDGIDLLTGKQVDVYYHGLLAAKEILTGEKPTIHIRL